MIVIGSVSKRYAANELLFKLGFLCNEENWKATKKALEKDEDKDFVDLCESVALDTAAAVIMFPCLKKLMDLLIGW